MNLVTTLSGRIGALEADLMKTKKTYSSAYTKLILKVKKLESQIKIGKARRQARVVLSDDEAFKDDSSKHGRKLSDEEVQEKASTDTELFIQEVTPTEVIQDQEGSEKASDEVSTAGAKKGTASEEVPIVSTAEVSLSTAGGTVTYTRRSAEKRSRQDKGKAIMIEEEPKKKSKKELEQERLSYAEAIRLEEQMNEEQRAQIARDEEIARQWDEEERKRAMDEAKTAKKIDWNDPSVIRYHTQKMKPKTVAQARRNMIKYLKNQGNYKISDFKGITGSEKQILLQRKVSRKVEEEEIEYTRKLKEVVKEPEQEERSLFQRKAQGRDKFPIVDWKTYVLTETFMYYQVFRGDGSSKNYKILSEMLEDFDRQDVEELYRLVKERYSTSRPEGFDLMLWGDLHTLFEPDEIWKDQHEYKLLSWRLYDFSGIHILLMENGLAIHMLTEKKYPLSQEMLTKMLSRKLEIDHESSQAFELLRNWEKLKLDGEVEINEKEATEEVIKGYKKIREKNDPGVFVLHIRIEAKFNTHALADTGSNINVIPYRIYAKLGREEVKLVNKNITMLDHSKVEPMGILKDVLCQVAITTILAKFLITDIPVDKDVPIEESDDDEEEYIVKRDKNGKRIYGPKFAKYLNYDNPMDRALTLQEAINPFRKICIWKKMVDFLGSLLVPLQHMEWIPNYSDSFIKKGDGDRYWHVKVRIVDPYGNIFDQGYKTKATKRELSKFYKSSDIMSPD
ncbi:putative reverse transcriptase domain-containing protein [Tanacetum coccineum]